MNIESMTLSIFEVNCLYCGFTALMSPLYEARGTGTDCRSYLVFWKYPFKVARILCIVQIAGSINLPKTFAIVHAVAFRSGN